MIFDKLERYMRYASSVRGLTAAFEYLAKTDFSAIKPGRIELNDRALYALVQEYLTKPTEQGIWEAHRQYIDVQYIVNGSERILFAPIESLEAGTYDPTKDFLPLNGHGSTVDLPAGFFVIFFPEDAHMPGLAIDQPETVKKVVVKVRVE